MESKMRVTLTGERIVSRQKMIVVAVDSAGVKVPWPEEFKEAFKG